MPLVLLKHLPYINEYFIGLSLLSDSLKNHCSGGNFTLPPRNGTVLAISLTDTFMAVIWLKDRSSLQGYISVLRMPCIAIVITQLIALMES